MKICRYPDVAGPAWGVLDGEDVRELIGDPFGDFEPGLTVAAASATEFSAPCEPSKVVCVGRNYRSLLAEQGREIPAHPFLFLKASTAVVGPGANVLVPTGVQDMAHEGELAVVIGTTARQLTEEEAWSAVLGYTCANDITVRDWQGATDQWLRAKSSDTHCPLGPWIETELKNPEDVGVRTLVNDEVRQDGRTDDLVFSIPQLLAYVSEHMTLLPGDVLLTGTSAGIRPVAPGDIMKVEIEGIGELTNPVSRWPMNPTISERS